MALKITVPIKEVMDSLVADMGDEPKPVFIGRWPHGGQYDWCDRGASIARYLTEITGTTYRFDRDTCMLNPQVDEDG